MRATKISLAVLLLAPAGLAAACDADKQGANAPQQSQAAPAKTGGGAEKAPEAAETLGITAARLKSLGLVDRVIPEPVGGAHRDPQQMAQVLKRALSDSLRHLQGVQVDELLRLRHERIMAYGKFKEVGKD